MENFRAREIAKSRKCEIAMKLREENFCASEGEVVAMEVFRDRKLEIVKLRNREIAMIGDRTSLIRDRGKTPGVETAHAALQSVTRGNLAVRLAGGTLNDQTEYPEDPRMVPSGLGVLCFADSAEMEAKSAGGRSDQIRGTVRRWKPNAKSACGEVSPGDPVDRSLHPRRRRRNYRRQSRLRPRDPCRDLPQLRPRRPKLAISDLQHTQQWWPRGHRGAMIHPREDDLRRKVDQNWGVQLTR